METMKLEKEGTKQMQTFSILLTEIYFLNNNVKPFLHMNIGIVLQALLDEEQEEMDAAAFSGSPRNTDSFDYENYHTLNEVSAPLYRQTTESSSSK